MPWPASDGRCAWCWPRESSLQPPGSDHSPGGEDALNRRRFGPSCSCTSLRSTLLLHSADQRPPLLQRQPTAGEATVAHYGPSKTIVQQLPCRSGDAAQAQLNTVNKDVHDPTGGLIVIRHGLLADCLSRLPIDVARASLGAAADDVDRPGAELMPRS